MKKMPTVYLRDPENRRCVTDVVNPECQWVIDGEGVPTRKWDGTCVMLDANGAWWARREVKPGKTVPSGFISVDYDYATGKTMGWEPIANSSFAKFHEEAHHCGVFTEGTYELVGPKINGNPERIEAHWLIRHSDSPHYDGVLHSPKNMVKEMAIYERWEGIVWHHPDGRMAKLKAKDLR